MMDAFVVVVFLVGLFVGVVIGIAIEEAQKRRD